MPSTTRTRVGSTLGKRTALVVRSPVSRRFVPWADVDELVLQPFIAYPEVRVKLRSGQLLRTGLVQGRRMYWSGGASADVLGELNRELELGRARKASTSPPLNQRAGRLDPRARTEHRRHTSLLHRRQLGRAPGRSASGSCRSGSRGQPACKVVVFVHPVVRAAPPSAGRAGPIREASSRASGRRMVRR